MSDKKTATKKTADKTTAKIEPHEFAFSKENYIMMAAGMVVLIIGFWLMSGKEDIFSTTKLTVAPFIVIIGFIIELFAVIRKPKN